MKVDTEKIRILAIICCCLLIICLFIFLYQLYLPWSKNVEEKIFIIEAGEGLEKIAENLRAERLISSKSVFVWYVWLEGKANNLQAGKYSLSPSMSIVEIAKKIINGDVFHDWIKITIPEGWTNRQIEERLLNLGLITANEKLLGSLEGYLFPDTYYFDKGVDTLETLIKKMQENFLKKIGEEISQDLLADSSMKLRNAVIMASILEKEVKSDEDRAIVAGIFWKRLEDNYPLESCATIAYILGVDKWRYSIEDTRIESPYNTYINIGLPPAPINNPGLSAIKAAIYPKETDYYFFLTDPETGNTVFSKTFEEHNRNKVEYFK
jgi:UPF0755 protein